MVAPKELHEDEEERSVFFWGGGGGIFVAAAFCAGWNEKWGGDGQASGASGRRCCQPSGPPVPKCKRWFFFWAARGEMFGAGQRTKARRFLLLLLEAFWAKDKSPPSLFLCPKTTCAAGQKLFRFAGGLVTIPWKDRIRGRSRQRGAGGGILKEKPCCETASLKRSFYSNLSAKTEIITSLRHGSGLFGFKSNFTNAKSGRK